MPPCCFYIGTCEHLAPKDYPNTILDAYALLTFLMGVNGGAHGASCHSHQLSWSFMALSFVALPRPVIAMADADIPWAFVGFH